MTTKNNVARVGRIVSRVAKLVPAVSTLGGVGAVVAVAPDANAGVVQSSVVNLNIPSTTSGVYINVVNGVSATTPAGAPGWDINPWGSGSFFMWSAASGGVMIAPGGSSGLTGNLPIGTLVNGTGNFGTSDSSQFAPGPGQFQLNATNYVGFRFLDEVDSLTHFGWATVILGTAANSQPRTIGQIWYEDQANTGILVGNTTSATPEPSSAALLAMGVVGLLAVRRRRQKSC